MIVNLKIILNLLYSKETLFILEMIVCFILLNQTIYSHFTRMYFGKSYKEMDI